VNEKDAQRLLGACEHIFRQLRRIADALERLSPPPAIVVDLDDKNGNPTTRFDPRDWKGPSHKGKRFSLCPPEYLELLAKAFDYFAEQESDEKKKRFKLLDAARARGWAQRNRERARSTASSSTSSSPASNSTPATSDEDLDEIGDDDSFDFGANVEGPEEEDPLPL
jgi:hypothetical protein